MARTVQVGVRDFPLWFGQVGMNNLPFWLVQVDVRNFPLWLVQVGARNFHFLSSTDSIKFKTLPFSLSHRIYFLM